MRRNSLAWTNSEMACGSSTPLAFHSAKASSVSGTLFGGSSPTGKLGRHVSPTIQIISLRVAPSVTNQPGAMCSVSCGIVVPLSGSGWWHHAGSRSQGQSPVISSHLRKLRSWRMWLVFCFLFRPNPHTKKLAPLLGIEVWISGKFYINKDNAPFKSWQYMWATLVSSQPAWKNRLGVAAFAAGSASQSIAVSTNRAASRFERENARCMSHREQFWFPQQASKKVERWKRASSSRTGKGTKKESSWRGAKLKQPIATNGARPDAGPRL